MSHNSPAHLQVQELTVSYNGKAALDAVSFAVPEGTRVAIVGPNGAGKSTLFKALVGLLPIKRGHILIHGESFGSHQECVAYVPQREEVDWQFPVTVSDVVMMGRYGRLGWLKRPTTQDREVVAHALEQMGVNELAQRSIGELSGGQQQRVFLARALAQEPHILLMDEPFTGVDVTTQETTLALLDRLESHGVTLMVSTHDLNLAASRFERVLLLNHRVIAYGTPAEVLTTDHIVRAFGAQVMLLNGDRGKTDLSTPSKAIVIDQCCPPEESVVVRADADSELHSVR